MNEIYQPSIPAFWCCSERRGKLAKQRIAAHGDMGPRPAQAAGAGDTGAYFRMRNQSGMAKE